MNQQPEALLMAEHLDDRGLIEEAAELRRLHEENEALRKDAERYRWLRDQRARMNMVDMVFVEVPADWYLAGSTTEEDDAAIDAMMKAREA